MSSRFILAAAIGLTGFSSAQLWASSIRLPEEYESTGGHSLAFGGSVASGIGGASAIRANPALLALEKEYTVNGAYHWPTAGRDYYQLGVVDGKTSSLAAGFAYTGAFDDYQGISEKRYQESTTTKAGSSSFSKDSPIVRRAALALALPVGRVYLGLGGGYVEARPPSETLAEGGADKIRGFTLGGGIAAHLSPALRLGFSAENLANRKVQFAAPTFYRAGVSYFAGDFISVHLDYRSRQAVAEYEGAAPSFTLAAKNDDKAPGQETLINASTSVKLYDLLRLVTSVGQSKSDEYSATRAGGGLSLINQKFSFSYQVLKPNLAEAGVHHAVALGLDVAI